MKRQLRVLYIARAFPPTPGGMETLAERLSESMRRYADVTLIANRRGKRALPIFLPSAFTAAMRLARGRQVDAILLADALLAPLGLALKRATALPVASTVHGLDILYPNRFYQTIVPRSVSRLDMTMPNSKATEKAVYRHAGPQTPTTVIPLGVNPLPGADDAAVQKFKARAGVNGGPVLLTAGRLVRRKGVPWFVEHVLPRLPESATYVVVGEGAEAETIRAVAAGVGVADRLRLLGRVSAEELSAAYRASDVFVMPNVPVAGDMEGFGLVALEAAAAGLPVVASRLEGITEAVRDGCNGLLLTPGSSDEYTEALREMLDLSPTQRRAIGAACRDYTVRTYGWDAAARRYVDVLWELVAQ